MSISQQFPVCLTPGSLAFSLRTTIAKQTWVSPPALLWSVSGRQDLLELSDQRFVRLGTQLETLGHELRAFTKGQSEPEGRGAKLFVRLGTTSSCAEFSPLKGLPTIHLTNKAHRIFLDRKAVY